MEIKKKSHIGLILILSFILSACQANWEIPVKYGEGTLGVIDKGIVSFYIEKSQEELDSIPLGQMFYDIGYTLIDEVSFITEKQPISTYNWDDIAKSTIISPIGEITLADSTILQPAEIEVTPSDLLSVIDFSILDISPTVVNALELSEFPQTAGRVIYETKADHAVIILLDGTQYQKLSDLVAAGQLPFLGENTTIQRGLTVYPSISTSGSAAFLTGLRPRENGVFGYGYRDTEATTIFDIAAQDGKSVIAIEGNSLPFNLRNAETTLSGDRDGNGFSDDNVYENALDIIETQMPDLLYIHFHEIDDMGHTYGPESDQYESAINRVDGYLASIYNALPESTLMIIFADHGMHTTNEGGNHGTLTADDLIIPIIFLEK
jgi:predicted AlkP superfamily pyrophosphatase or phosphodiesterase